MGTISFIIFFGSISIHSNLDDPIRTELLCRDYSGNEIVDSKCIQEFDPSREMLRIITFTSMVSTFLLLVASGLTRYLEGVED